MNSDPIHKPEALWATGVIFEDIKGGCSCSWEADDVRLVRSYTVKVRVFVSSVETGPIDILNSFPLAIGDNYRYPIAAGGSSTEQDTGSFLQSVSLEPESEDQLQWIATMQFGPFDVRHQLGSSVISQGLIDPTERAPEVYWTTAKYGRSKTEDESTNFDEEGNSTGGKPYLNTVGDPLLDPPSVEESRPCLKITRNESTYNDDYAGQFKDCVNEDEFLGYPPNTVKCADITGERFYDPDWGYYFRVTYQFEMRDDDDGNGYTNRVLNAGYRQKVGGTGDPQQITINGQPITDAVPLQQDGSYQPDADPYYLEFQDYPKTSFAALNIPAEILTENT